MKFLIVSHPRSGSGYAAKLLQTAGYDVGHEKMGINGTSNWMWPLKDTSPPYGEPYDPSFQPDITIHLIRNPLHCISSVRYTETTTEEYRAAHVNIQADVLPAYRAMQSILDWHGLCQAMKPDYTVKTENLRSFLLAKLDIKTQDIPPQNRRPHPVIPEQAITKRSPWADFYETLVNQWEQAE